MNDLLTPDAVVEAWAVLRILDSQIQVLFTGQPAAQNWADMVNRANPDAPIVHVVPVQIARKPAH